MATKTFEELKQMAIQIRDEKTNKQNTATRIGTQMLEHLNKLEQDFLDKGTTEGKFSELEKDINIYNVTTSKPLSTDEYYNHDTAINAVPLEIRKFGLKIQYFDGVQWNYEQFVSTNFSKAWENKANWITYYRQNQHLIGKVFKPTANLELRNLSNMPIIDIFVAANPQNKRIFLKAAVMITSTNRMTVQFVDETDNIISQFTTTTNIPTGYTKLRCEEYNSSGVIVDVILNCDILPGSSDSYPDKLEIVQKTEDDAVPKLENRVSNLEEELIGEDIVELKKETTAILNALVPIYKNTSIQVILDDESVGAFSSYRIFICEDKDFTNQTLYADKCTFGVTYNINNIDEKFKYAYIFNNSTSNNGYSGRIIIINDDSILPNLENRVSVVENALKESGSDVVTFKKDLPSRLTETIPIYENTNLQVILDDEFSGVFGDYNLFVCEDEERTNLTPYRNKCSFGVTYKIADIDKKFKYAYIFNASENNNGYSGRIIITDNNSYEARLASIEKSIKLVDYTIVSLGDSLTEFTYQGKGYVEYLQEYSGAKVIRGGIGGTRFAQRAEPSLTPQDTTTAYAALDMVNLVKAWTTNDWSYVDAAVEYLKGTPKDDNTEIVNNLKNTPISEVDVITLLAATNDLTGGSKIGDLASIEHDEICGAINEIIRMLLTANINLRIFVFSPTVRYVTSEQSDETWSDNYKGTQGATTTLPDLITIMENCVKRWNIPYCNLYKTLGWNRLNFSNYFIEGDNTHPYKGFSTMARKMLGFIEANRNF